MNVPFKYVLRNFKARKLTTGITIFGISLVVFVFTAILMMAYGVEKTLQATGSPENIKVSRKAATGEISSIIDADVQNVIKTLPFVEKNAAGEQIISVEPVVVVNLEIQSGGLSNITARGVSEKVFELRPQVKIVKGRVFNFGSRELIVGESIPKKFMNANIGDKMKIAGDYWTVVGLFSTDGSGFDSEIWGDTRQLLSAFNRGSSVSTLTFKMHNPDELEALKRAFSTDKRLNQFEPEPESKYYEKQSEFLAVFIRVLGIVITVIFSFGATIGAMITMYAAVANRTREIGTMRALGFSRISILTAFMSESFFIALIGWGIGVVLAFLLSFQKVSTLNFGSWSELEFGFAVNPEILISSLIFALLMGFIGGFLPAFRASRMNIVNSLRSA